MVDPIESLLPQDCSHVSLKQIEGACDRRLFFLGLPSIHSPLLLQNSKCNRVSFERVTKCWDYFAGDLMKSWARTEIHLPWCFTKIQFATTTRLNEELTADLTLGTASSPICNVLSNFYCVFEQNFLLACWSVIRQTKQIMFYYLILWLSHTRVPDRFLLSVRTKSKTENFVH